MGGLSGLSGLSGDSGIVGVAVESPTDPLISLVQFLLHGSEYDGSANAFSPTIGPRDLIASNSTTRPTVDTVRSRFGQSIRLHQTHGDARSFWFSNQSGPYDFIDFSADFTVEVSIYLDSKHAGTAEHQVIGSDYRHSTNGGWGIQVNRPSGWTIRFLGWQNNAGGGYLIATVTLPDTAITDSNGMLETGIWHSICVERYGSTWSIYHGTDGGNMTRYTPTMTYSTLTATSDFGGGYDHLMTLGAWWDLTALQNTASLIGSLEEARITSAARYEAAASYATPDAPFPDT